MLNIAMLARMINLMSLLVGNYIECGYRYNYDFDLIISYMSLPFLVGAVMFHAFSWIYSIDSMNAYSNNRFSKTRVITISLWS
jgi:hypothetical protein